VKANGIITGAVAAGALLLRLAGIPRDGAHKEVPRLFVSPDPEIEVPERIHRRMIRGGDLQGLPE